MDEEKKIPDEETVSEPKRIQHGSCIIEIYDNLNELYRVSDSRKINSWAPVLRDDDGKQLNKARLSKPDNFTPRSYEETKERTRTGVEEDTKKLNQEILETDKLFGWDRGGKAKFKWDVYGSSVSVPRALRGEPKAMRHRNVGIRKGKIINIVYDISVNWRISAEQQLQKGAEVISVINQLEREGYRVRLDILSEFTDDDILYGMRVKLKSEWNMCNLKKLSGVLLDVCYQRRISFDWYERLPGAKYLSSYGYPLMNSGKMQEKFKEEFLQKNDYYICFSSDVKEVFKEQLSLDKNCRDER